MDPHTHTHRLDTHPQTHTSTHTHQQWCLPSEVAGIRIRRAMLKVTLKEPGLGLDKTIPFIKESTSYFLAQVQDNLHFNEETTYSQFILMYTVNLSTFRVSHLKGGRMLAEVGLKGATVKQY